MSKAKLTTLERLVRMCQLWKEKGKRIVFANGIFDILHVGHVRYLKDAKKEGDILIVGINTDNSVRKLKGPKRPIFSEKERALLISSLKCVDYVFLYPGINFSSALKLLRPHIHAKGTDYSKDTVPERETVLSYGGEIKIVGDPKRHSTSWLLQKIGGK